MTINQLTKINNISLPFNDYSNNSQSRIIAQTSTSPLSNFNLNPETVITWAKSPSGMMLIGALVGFGILQLLSDGKKGKIATGYWGNTKEKNVAKKKLDFGQKIRFNEAHIRPKKLK